MNAKELNELSQVGKDRRQARIDEYKTRKRKRQTKKLPRIIKRIDRRIKREAKYGWTQYRYDYDRLTELVKRDLEKHYEDRGFKVERVRGLCGFDDMVISWEEQHE